MPVPKQESKRSCMCVKSIDFALFSGFEIVPNVCYFLLVLVYDYFVLAFMFQSKQTLLFKALLNNPI